MAGLEASNRFDEYISAVGLPRGGIVSGHGFYLPCPPSLGANASCATTPPPININITTLVSPEGDFSTFNASLPSSDANQPIVTEDTYYPIANLIQTIIAIARIDLGNPSGNNFLLNSSVLNSTIYSAFPPTTFLGAAESELYKAYNHPERYELSSFPLDVEGPAKMQVAYTCRFQQWKNPGTATISVLVATLSMFSAGWAIFTLIATYWITYNSEEGKIVTHASFNY